MAPHRDGSPKYLRERVGNSEAAQITRCLETASSLILQQRVVQNPLSIGPAAVRGRGAGGECRTQQASLALV